MLLALAIGLAMPAAAQWDPPQGTTDKAQAVYLYQLDTETLVYAKNENERRAPASLTKLMTALLLVESGQPLDTPFTIPDGLQPEFNEILANYGTRAGLLCGETVTLQDLLYGCLLPSGNDAASAIAYYLGNGDMQAFFDRMNARAAELGCENTNFTCAHGLYGLEYGNHSTAWDMFLIGKAFRENDLLMEVVTQTGYWMPLTNVHTTPESADAPEGAAYYITTTNVMQLPDQELYRPYIRGIKTGFTDEAGRCFVSSAESGGMTWLLVVMGAPIQLAEDGFNWAFHTTADLYDWALVNFWPVALPNTETPVASVPVKWCAEADTVDLYAASTLTTLQCANSTVEVVAEDVPETLEAPVQAGQAAGRAVVYVDGEAVGTVELVTAGACQRSAWLYYKEQLAPFAPALIAAAVLAALLLFGAARASARRRKRARRAAKTR